MKKTKIAVPIMILMLLLSVTACKKDAAETTAAASETAMTQESVTETTTAQATVATTTGLYDPNNSMAINPITGIQDMDPANVGMKSVSIVVNNVYAAMPQRGISAADAIYEYETEGGITRLLAVFADVSKVPEIGSIRSARIISASLAAGNNSIFIHFGREPRAVSFFTTNDIAHIDGNYLSAGKYSSSDYEDGYVDLPNHTYFWRDKTWASKRAIEHTAVTDGAHLVEAMTYKNIVRETGEAETPLLFNFVPDNSTDITQATQTCSSINVYFSGNNDDALFEYNATDGLYYKSQYGDPQIDETNGQQLAVKNVFVLYARVAAASDNYRTDYFLDEGGSGYYICDGKIVNVTWSKASVNDPIVVLNEAGQPIQVNRGKSYICMVRASQADKSTINP